MKVGLFLASDFKEGNGANARIKAYAKGLKEEGVNVDILFLHASSFNNTLVNNQKEGFWQGIFYKFLNNRVTRPYSILGKLLDSLKSIVGSTYYILKHRQEFDLFYLYMPKLHQFFHIFLLAKILGIKTVAEKTELYSAFSNDQASLKNWLLQQIEKMDEANSQKWCDHLVVISSNLYQFYRQYFPEDRITKLPIIVDMERFTHLNGDPKKPYRVGYLGSFGEKDGVPGIIDAFAQAHHQIKNLKLRLMGYNPNEAATKAHIDHYQLNGAVEHLGQVCYSDIPDLLHECDLLIVNRTDSSYSHYGFPTKLGEYLATGRPTVVTRVGDIPKYFEHKENTYIIEPEDTEGLAEAIKERYAYYDYFDEIGESGKEATQRFFDYSIHVNKLCRLFKQLKPEAEEGWDPDNKPDNGMKEHNSKQQLPNVKEAPSYATKD